MTYVRFDGQTIVDEEYVGAAVKRFELMYLEMQPGHAVVFDCNMLHRSDAHITDGLR